MWDTILNIVLAIISIALAGITYYLDVKNKIQAEVNGKIDAAEDTELVGESKMAAVVDSIYYNIVPQVLRPIFTKSKIEKIVQKAFDKIEDYAQKQANKDKK